MIERCLLGINAVAHVSVIYEFLCKARVLFSLDWKSLTMTNALAYTIIMVTRLGEILPFFLEKIAQWFGQNFSHEKIA